MNGVRGWRRGAVFAVPLALGCLAPLHSALACSSDLTGRSLALTADEHGFGSVQGQPHLPLGPQEYVVTIDDGPEPATTLTLAKILQDRCVRATFFFVGWKAERHPEIVREVLAMGHHVGSHSFSHPDFGNLSGDEQFAQMVKGERAVNGVRGDGQSSPLVRLPGASGMSPVPPDSLVQRLVAAGYVIAGYDISSEDWRNSPPEESLHRLTDRLGQSGVIVFHDGQSNTLKLMPMALDELEARHAKIVDIAR